jgi:hypothetical protein
MRFRTATTAAGSTTLVAAVMTMSIETICLRGRSRTTTAAFATTLYLIRAEQVFEKQHVAARVSDEKWSSRPLTRYAASRYDTRAVRACNDESGAKLLGFRCATHVPMAGRLTFAVRGDAVWLITRSRPSLPTSSNAHHQPNRMSSPTTRRHRDEERSAPHAGNSLAGGPWCVAASERTRPCRPAAPPLGHEARLGDYVQWSDAGPDRTPLDWHRAHHRVTTHTQDHELVLVSTARHERSLSTRHTPAQRLRGTPRQA